MPDRWVEFLPDSGVRLRTTTIKSAGMRPGRRLPAASSTVQTKRMGEGTLNLEVATKGMGVLFRHMLGDDRADGTIAVVQGATIAYLHTYILGPMRGSLTIQTGVQRVDDPDEVEPFTAVGCMFPQWTLTCAVDQIATLSLTVDARDVLDSVNDSETLATAAYPAGVKVFHFAQGSVLVDSVPVANVTAAEVAASWNLATERYHFGADGLKAQPRNTWGDAITGSFTADFGDPADLYVAYHDNTTVGVELEFVGDNIASTFDERLTVSIPAVKLMGEGPMIAQDLVQVTVPWEGLEPASGSALTFEYMTTDTAP